MQCAIARASYAQAEDVSHSSDSLLVPGLSSGQPGPIRGMHGGKALGRPQDLGSQVDSRKGIFVFISVAWPAGNQDRKRVRGVLHGPKAASVLSPSPDSSKQVPDSRRSHSERRHANRQSHPIMHPY